MIVVTAETGLTRPVETVPVLTLTESRNYVVNVVMTAAVDVTTPVVADNVVLAVLVKYCFCYCACSIAVVAKSHLQKSLLAVAEPKAAQCYQATNTELG